MATIILAEAAYADKLQAVQSQSYGIGGQRWPLQSRVYYR